MTSYSPNGVDLDRSYQTWSEDAGRAFYRGWLQPAMSVALRYGLALVSVSVALRFGTYVFVLWSSSALYRICAIRDRGHVLVLRHKARHSRGLDLVACPRLLLRTRSQRRISHSVWLGVPGFCIRDDPASCEGETSLKPESRSELRS